MCGIIGIISKQPVAERILEGLQRLEYRGYDSAGVAIIRDGKMHIRRAVGRISASAFTQSPADPSPIGSSGPRTSTSTSAKPMPTTADIRCSTVRTRACPDEMVDASRVSVTASACVDIANPATVAAAPTTRPSATAWMRK